jgi:putative PEP-CTERM system TPR-repeat lipoprotein
MRHRPARIAIVTLIALSAATLGGCHRGQSTDSLLSDAKQFLQKGDKNASLIQLKNALAQSPDNTEARLMLAGLYNDLRDPVSAEKEVRKALSLGARPERALPILGAALLGQGQYDKVLDETKGEENQRVAAVAALRGRAYLALAKRDKAKAAFDQALKLEPGNVDALTGLAGHAAAMKDYAGASRYSQQAIDSNPKNLDARFFKAELLRALGQDEAAKSAYDEVLALDPNNAIAHLLKAHVAIGLRQFDAAKVDIDAARKASPKLLSVYYAQARLDYAQGKYAAAMESLLEVLRAAPKDAPALLLAAATQHALGSWSQAETYLKNYLEVDPNSLYARKLMATIRLKAGQPQDALAVLQPPLKDEVADVELYSLAGEAALKAGNYSKATAYFEYASTLAPNTAKLHEGLAMSVLGQGNSRRAVDELETAASLDQQSPQAGVMLVMTHLRLKQLDKAMVAAKALAKAQPANPLAPYLQGVILVGRNDLGNARLAFQKAQALQPGYYEPVSGEAQLDLREGKRDAAKHRYIAFLQQDKKHLGAMTSLATLALIQHKPDEAVQWLEKALAENPEAVEPAVLLAGHYLRNGDKQKALTLAKNLQTAHPSDVNVLDLLGQAQAVNGDLNSALESYSKLAALRPSSPLAQFRMAQSYLALGNLPATVSALKNALALRPDYLEAQQALVLVETKRNNLDQAIAYARLIQKQNPKLDLGYVLEGDTLMWKNKPDLAAKSYAQGYTMNRTGATMVKLHDALTRFGKGKEADIFMAQFQAAQPKDITSRMYLGGVALAAKRYKAAEQQYQAILQLDPQNAEALNNLAWVLHEEKDASALGYAEKAYQLQANNSAVMDTLGWILVEQGDTARGLPLLKKAATMAPAAPDLRYRLAVGLMKSGDKPAARKELEQLLLNNKNFSKSAEAQALLRQL